MLTADYRMDVRISDAALHPFEEMDEGGIMDHVSYRVPEDISSVEGLREYSKSYELELFRRNFI